MALATRMAFRFANRGGIVFDYEMANEPPVMKRSPSSLHALSTLCRKTCLRSPRNLALPTFWKAVWQKSGDAVRVNVQPTKAANDSHLWARCR